LLVAKKKKRNILANVSGYAKFHQSECEWEIWVSALNQLHDLNTIKPIANRIARVEGSIAEAAKLLSKLIYPSVLQPE